MAYRTITAKYAGTCRRCGTAIEPGSRMRYGGRGRSYHLKADCPSASDCDARPPSSRLPRFGPVDDTPGALASYYDPRGVYSRDGTFLGTVGPRCEDAPCCGCCS